MKKALFLDRDGIINKDLNYVHRKEDFIFVDGIFELCKNAKYNDMLIVVVTNQAGIGRGYYTEKQFDILNEWMLSRFRDKQIHIDAVYYCPYHPVHGLGEFKRDSNDRKPNPGMLLRAETELGVDLVNSILVGDNLSDVAAAKSACVGTTVLMSAAKKEIHPKPDFHASSLYEVNALLFGEH